MQFCVRSFSKTVNLYLSNNSSPSKVYGWCHIDIGPHWDSGVLKGSTENIRKWEIPKTLFHSYSFQFVCLCILQFLIKYRTVFQLNLRSKSVPKRRITCMLATSIGREHCSRPSLIWSKPRWRGQLRRDCTAMSPALDQPIWTESICWYVLWILIAFYLESYLFIFYPLRNLRRTISYRVFFFSLVPP